MGTERGLLAMMIGGLRAAVLQKIFEHRAHDFGFGQTRRHNFVGGLQKREITSLGTSAVTITRLSSNWNDVKPRAPGSTVMFL